MACCCCMPRCMTSLPSVTADVPARPMQTCMLGLHEHGCMDTSCLWFGHTVPACPKSVSVCLISRPPSILQLLCTALPERVWDAQAWACVWQPTTEEPAPLTLGTESSPPPVRPHEKAFM